MADFLPWLALAALVGAGVVTGLLFAFSNFVMHALQQGAPEDGMRTMQRINVTILNPLFLLFFAGTAVASLVLVGGTVTRLGEAAAYVWWLAGGVLYLVGVFGVTAAFNVPLNNRLEATDISEATTAWPAYVRPWMRWNHIRTALGTAAIAALGRGLMVVGG